MNAAEFETLYNLHLFYLENNPNGQRLYLQNEDLRNVNLKNKNLQYADFRGANLHGANLYSANLHHANLRNADLRGADLCGADLCGADLRGADLRGADLRNADLRSTNFTNVKLRIYVTDNFVTYITPGYIRINCKNYSVEEWKQFTDENIITMSEPDNYLKLWNAHKHILFAIEETLH